MKKVLLPEKIAGEALALLKNNAEVIACESHSEDAVISRISDAFGLVLRSKARITRRVLEAAPGLKIISRTGVGYDNVDVAAATEHGVMVCSLPGINTVSVAEHAMTFILTLAKRISRMDGYVRSGQWEKRSEGTPVELEGKTLGIVGLGRIGQRVMEMASVFGMNTIAYDPYVESLQPGKAVFVKSLEELFSRSDFISVHVPNLAETKHMVTADLLNRMKPDAFIINTSRGEVIDEQALINALKENRIGGAGLDVFGSEPVEHDNPLLKLENVVLTPHTAALTKECGLKMAIEAVRQVVDCIEGRVPPYIVNRKELGL